MSDKVDWRSRLNLTNRLRSHAAFCRDSVGLPLPSIFYSIIVYTHGILTDTETLSPKASQEFLVHRSQLNGDRLHARQAREESEAKDRSAFRVLCDL